MSTIHKRTLLATIEVLLFELLLYSDVAQSTDHVLHNISVFFSFEAFIACLKISDR